MDPTLGLIEKKYILYVKNKCPFCVKATEILKSNKIKFETISFDKRPKVLKEMKNIYQWDTVPMVFERVGINTYRMIGGFTDLQKHIEKNKDGRLG